MKRKSKQSAVAAISVLTAITCAAPAARLYKDVATTDLNTVANWAITSGGATDPASIGTSDALRFNEIFAPTSGTNYTASLSADLAVGGIQLDSGSVNGGSATGNIIIAAGNTLTLNGASAADIIYANGGIVLNSATGGTLTVNADIIVGASQQWVTSRNLTVGGTINLGANTLSFNTAGSGIQALNGVISGTGSLNKTAGPGTLTLGHTDNSFEGAVTLVGGTTTITKLANGGSHSSLGKGSSAIVLNGAALTYSGAGGDTTDRAIDMRAGAAINNNSTTGPISFTAANVIQGGTASARILSLGGSNIGANTFSSILGNSTGFTSTLQKNGTGKWIATGTQLYSGATIINQGTLRVAGSAVLGGDAGATGATIDAGNIWFSSNNANGVLEFESAANLGPAAQIRFRNTAGGTAAAGTGGALNFVGTTSQTVSKAIQCDTSFGVRLESNSVGGSVDFSGSWENVAGNRPIYLGGTGTGTNTISGSINANGSGSLTKRDSGTWVLSGNNTYTGSTNINGGTLIAGSTGALANSPVNLAGGTLASTVNGTVATTGTLSLSGGVTSKIDFGSGTTVLSFANSNAASWTAGSTLQIWNWTGNLSGGGADQLIFASAGLDATKISQVTFVDPNGLSGSFGAQFVGNELVPVPEPSPLMIGLGLLGMALYRRSRV